MNLNKFTEKAQEAVMTAQNLASELNHAEITPEHLLVALVEQSGGIVPSILRKLTLDPRAVAADARALLTTLPQAYGADLRFSPRMKLSSTRRRPRRSGCRTNTSAPSTCSSRWPPKPAAPRPRSCCSGAASPRTRSTRR